MSHAAKYRKRAVEFEQLKQFDKAIASYIRAIDETEAAGEEVDVAVFNKVGDLTLRLGRIPDAVTYYERAVEHYASVGLFNNAIALCNKILRNAPGRSTIYFTLGRICAKKGLRGDASRNFLEYVSRMRSEGRTDEAMRALAEVTELMPELTEVRGLVEEYAALAGIELKRRDTPTRAAALNDGDTSRNLVFLDVNFVLPEERPRPSMQPEPVAASRPRSWLDDVMIFDPNVSDAESRTSSVDDLENELALPAAAPVVVEEAEDPATVVESSVIGIEHATETSELEAVTSAVAGLTALDPESEESSVASAPLAELTSRIEVERVVVATDGLVDNSAEFVAALGMQGGNSAVTVGGLEAIERANEVEQLTTEAGEFDVTLHAEAVAGIDSLIEDAIDEGSVSVEAESAIEQHDEPSIESNVESVVESNVASLNSETVDTGEASLPEAAIEAPIEASIEAPIEESIEASIAVPINIEAAPEVVIEAPFRLDPHNFILPGELPPLLIPDALLRREVSAGSSAVEVAGEVAGEVAVDVASDVASEVAADADVAFEEEAPVAATSTFDTPPAPVAVAPAVAAAHARHDLLAQAIADAPGDWPLRHRYAEALLEIGERERGIGELERALEGFASAGDLLAAFEIADELVQVGSHRIRHHQKRVELAVRLGDPGRLRISYLDLADALVRVGEDARAHAVYARVLEMDPTDERARMALGAAAPPLPASKVDDSYVDLASWLKEDDGSSTRMRMHEPTITGDEQADFDSLLRHFKEGVARSIGEDDHDSHYDLGVAYKEMGLLDDAVAEFQKALRSKVHRLPAYEALGQCFVEQGRHQVAATVLSRALHEPGLDDGHRIGVLYLLGYSLEALQRIDDARSYFERVYATDKHFRDVAARLAALDLVAQ